MPYTLRILLIDDNPDDRSLVMRELEREFPDLDAQQITDVKDFDQALEVGDFDLVITDYQLRWTDGLTVLFAVKARWPDCPVIMFTGTGSEEIAVEAMKGGLDDYVVKSPTHFVRLRAAVRSTLERARQRHALIEADIRYQSLFNNIPVGLYRTTPAGQVLDANPALVQMLGYPDRESLLAVSAATLYADPEAAKRWQAMMKLEGVVQDFEAQLRRLDGTIMWVRHSARAVRYGRDRVLYHEGVLEDITERKRSDEHLQRQREALYQSEKLVTMGQLLGAVADELSNPLSVVMGQTDLLRRSIRSKALAKRAEQVAQAAERCARIIRNFFALARHRLADRQPAQLNQIVREAVELLAYQLWAEDIEVRLNLMDDLPLVRADPRHIHLLVVHLIANAHQAMRETSPPRELTITTSFDPERASVCLEVADTGHGIPIELQARIFEPFFSTRPSGGGTGLGLALCRGIVAAHGGSIQVESQPGAGSRFWVEFPKADGHS